MSKLIEANLLINAAFSYQSMASLKFLTFDYTKKILVYLILFERDRYAVSFYYNYISVVNLSYDYLSFVIF